MKIFGISLIMHYELFLSGYSYSHNNDSRESVIYGKSINNSGIHGDVYFVLLNKKDNKRFKITTTQYGRKHTEFSHIIKPGIWVLKKIVIEDRSEHMEFNRGPVPVPKIKVIEINNELVFDIYPNQISFVGIWEINSTKELQIDYNKLIVDEFFLNRFPKLNLDSAITILSVPNDSNLNSMYSNVDTLNLRTEPQDIKQISIKNYWKKAISQPAFDKKCHIIIDPLGYLSNHFGFAVEIPIKNWYTYMFGAGFTVSEYNSLPGFIVGYAKYFNNLFDGVHYNPVSGMIPGKITVFEPDETYDALVPFFILSGSLNYVFASKFGLTFGVGFSANKLVQLGDPPKDFQNDVGYDFSWIQSSFDKELKGLIYGINLFFGYAF